MNSPKYIRDIKLKVPWGYVTGKTWGIENGQRVLVVHGMLDNAGSFDRILPLLPNDYYYVVIDLPGHGFSSPFPQGTILNFFDYVMTIRLVLDRLQWQNCIYIGHSLGAQLGFFTSVLYPERIIKLACLDGIIPIPIKPNIVVEWIKNVHDLTIRANESDKAPLYTEEEMLYALKNRRNFALTDDAARALLDRGRTKVGDLYKFSRDYRLRIPANPMFDVSYYQSLFKQVKKPIFLVVARWSWLYKSHSLRTLDDIKKLVGDKCTVVEVNGNHDVHNNNPEIVAPLLRKFLSEPVKSKL